MTGEEPTKVNNTQSILRANGKRVRIVDPVSHSTEDTTTTTAIDPKVAPSVAFKIVALKNLLSHHPEFETYMKPLLERFGSSYARVFFKQLKSNEINANLENHVPASAKFKFEPMLLDSIKNSEDATALLSEAAEYVENCHRDLSKFAARAFELNRRELVASLTRQHGGLLHAFAVALIAKHGATDYDADVAVLDYLCLYVNDVTAATNTTAAMFLKHYRAERKLASLPSPTMPTDNCSSIPHY